ncbi:Nramp family divalent metal transporter [Sporomusa acidovorans]|uniref:Divalent metal cation transporter MntH n=1 Tax=Sporomusa acidovorans (strain ATCC 49682 / DSM 3132 / Mol) TaxID=1123286 RepID=A0ABZ3IWA0_SPOA4|nr:Nramp family divalent metal transporter [Sporomusa acidovorans]OZC23638.1 divalent metal cation transporter MntH [Sporomusa acidovorans DSM 3132]SDE23512.1 NRAMP (natural resistance-associated macrophage protein) metal ion transporters [Sporomusa acidovorans]
MVKAIKGIRERLGLFLAVMGPGIVTAFADNDAGGIATYAAAGAKYGYALLFTMFVATVCLAIAQEISARTGAVTGKGLADLIREQFGVKWTLFAMVVLLIANIGTTASEFSGVATSFEIFGVNKYLSVPVIAGVVWWLVVKGSYERIEKIFLALCVTFFSYILSGIIVNPPWQEVLVASVTPSFSRDTEFLFMAIGVIGTTITPWGQFYVQASIVDKGIVAKDYVYTRWDVFIGSFFTGLVAFFIIVATAATLYVNHISMETAKDAALALEPLAGKYASLLFGFGLFGASMLAAFILPLSTAYAICEAFGFEHGMGKSYEEAPVFFGLYTALIAIGAALVLLPGLSLYNVMLISQVVNGVLLPPILIFMVVIANDKNIMGEYANSRMYNVLSWFFTIVLILLTVLLLAATVAPDAVDWVMVFFGL